MWRVESGEWRVVVAPSHRGGVAVKSVCPSFSHCGGDEAET